MTRVTEKGEPRRGFWLGAMSASRPARRAVEAGAEGVEKLGALRLLRSDARK